MPIWGTDCNFVQLSGKMIKKVLTPAGEESALYKEVLDHVQELPEEEKETIRAGYKDWEGDITGDLDNNKHLALALYSQTTSKNFTKWFGNGEKNEQGQPKLDEKLQYTNEQGAKKSLFNTGKFSTPKTPYQEPNNFHVEPFDTLGNIQAAFSRRDWLKEHGAQDVTLTASGIRYNADADNTYFQGGDTTSSKASAKTVKVWTDWFKNTGTDLNILTEGLVDEKGDKLKVNEAVDVVNRVVSVVTGHEDTSIPEAGMHIVSRIVKSNYPKLFKEMMSRIDKYNLFPDVVQEYKGFKNYQLADGKPDMAKIKEEAIGKVLAEYHILSQEGTTEKPELIKQAQSWWGKIKDNLRDFFKGNPFSTVVDKFNKGGLDNKGTGEGSDTFYSQEKSIKHELQKLIRTERGESTGNIIQAASSYFRTASDSESKDNPGSRDHQATSDIFYSQENKDKIKASLKSVSILQLPNTIINWSKLKKGTINIEQFIQNSQFPKEQKFIINDIYTNENPKDLNELLISLISKYSYTVEINTAKDNYNEADQYDEEGNRLPNNRIPIREETPTSYYSNLTVPGGTNYTENEIATPSITPSIKGHAQFSTDNGIGWFRSDDKVYGGKYYKGGVFEGEMIGSTHEGGIHTKERRILEVQSDLFQKGRDKEDLVNLKDTPEDSYKKFSSNGYDYRFSKEADDYYKTLQGSNNHIQITKKEYINEYNKLNSADSLKQNDFLQLLNKDGNWIPFFIKSIVQDSAKRGYENVLFPTGDTASKVEGHETLEDFKKQKKDRIKELEKEYNALDKEISNQQAFDRLDELEDKKREITQLQEELKRVEIEGFGALKPIHDFYENRVKNTLNKIYGKDKVGRITDEHGNDWYQVTVNPIRDKSEIFFQSTAPDKGQETFDKIAAVKEPDKVEGGEGVSHYMVNGQKVPNRVTDISHRYLEKIFRNKPQLKDKIELAINDQKKAFGIKGHGWVEDIMNRYVDRTTGDKRASATDTGLFFEPGDNDQFYYNQLESYLFGYEEEGVHMPGVVDSFPEGTKFLWEKKVYDPNRIINGEKGIAGTIDWMSITPQGKVNLLDWKFIGSLEKNESIRDYMKKSYDKQMENYVDILQKAYGVKPEDIAQVRIIPISVNYSAKEGEQGTAKGIKIGNADYSMEESDYLQPYITSSERTGDDKIDSLVQRLSGLLESIQAKVVSDKDKEIRRVKIDQLQKSILQIQLSRSFEPLLEQATTFNEDAKNQINQHIETLKTTDFSKIKSQEEFNKLIGPVVEIAKSLEVYKDLGDFTDWFDDKAMNTRLSAVKENSAYLFDEAQKLIRGYWQAYGILRRLRDIVLPQRKMEVIGAEGRTLSKTQLYTGQAFYDINNQKQNAVEIRTNDMVDKLEGIQDELRKWGDNKKYQDMLEQKDSKGKGINRLIDEYDPEFITQLTKHIEDKDLKWVQENVDLEKLSSWAKDYKAEQLDTINKLNLGEQEKQLKIDQVERMTNLKGKFAWTQLNILRRFPRTDSEVNWYSKEFKEVNKKGNEPVKELYNFIREWNETAAKSGYIEHYQKYNFLPWIEKSLAERIVLGGKWDVRDKIKEALTDPKYTELAERKDPVTGKLVPIIPKYFTRDISETRKGEKDYEGVSDDLVKNMGMYAWKVIDYNAKKDVEDIVESLVYLEKYKGMLETDSKGKLTGRKVTENKANVEYLEDAILQHFYEKSLLTNFDYKIKSTTIGDEERDYTLMKAVNGFKSAYSLNVLGFNLTTSVFRAITTNAAGLYNAGTFYTQGEFMKSFYDFCAMRTIKDDHKLTIGLMKDFLPVEENLHEELNKLTANKFTEANFQDILMKWVKSAHNIVQYTHFLSHMKNAVVIDGKLVNARDYIKGTDEYSKRYNLSENERSTIERSLENKVQALIKDKGLLNSVKWDEDKGKVDYGNLDLTDFSVADFKSLVRVGGRVLSGNISENDQSHIRSNALIRQMFLFTNWLPQQIDVRLGGLSYSQGTGRYEYGRMRMLGRILVDNFKDRSNTILSMYKATDKGVAALNKMYLQHKQEYEKSTGQELKMTPEEFYDMVRNNLRIQGRELLMVMSFATLAFAMASLLPNKNDPDYADAQGYFTFMKRVTNRAKDELELFYDPTKFMEFGTGDKLPFLRYFKDIAKAANAVGKEGFGIATGDQELTDKQHAAAKVLHILPFGNAVRNTIPIVDPDMAKYLGIHYTSEINGGAGK